MKLGVSIKIDVTKIDKARLFKGEKGTYLNLTTFIDTDQADAYGNHGFISQSVTQDERQQNVQTPILGNCKVFYTEGQNTAPPAQGRSQSAPPRQTGTEAGAGMDDFPDDSIPF